MPPTIGTVVIWLAPSKKATYPVGLLPATVAVKVTFWPALAGFGLTARVVEEALALTVSVTPLELLAELLVSPEYAAVRL